MKSPMPWPVAPVLLHPWRGHEKPCAIASSLLITMTLVGTQSSPM